MQVELATMMAFETESRQFGTVQYRENETVEFPMGLPAFENERRFVLIERSATKPIVFLQSLNAPDLCFVTLPLLVVDPAYQLAVTAEDLAAIGLGDLKGQQPVVGRQVQAYTIMAMTESGPAANLLAPIIVNISPWRDGRAALGIQAVRYDNRYAHDQLLVGTSC
ncbi:MAG: flagellar assembly protein FliW [Acidobacteria bacterium]|nr:flagellar assembly protein FliW [Acidobacteriota bacterium]